MKLKVFLLDAAHKAMGYFMMFLMAISNIQRPIAITASMTVLSSPLFAETSDTLLLDSLVQKYDLNNPTHRRQMKIRLLRMFHPNAKPILEQIAKAYQQKFNRPLRVTSLSRSMLYQIGLNKINTSKQPPLNPSDIYFF